jgi:hypothetical protein
MVSPEVEPIVDTQRGQRERAGRRTETDPGMSSGPQASRSSGLSPSVRARLGLWGGGRVITRDALCPRCEYNLNGLTIGSPCPECGHLIQTMSSARGEDQQLINAPRPYLKSLALGSSLIAAGMIAAVILRFQPRPLGFDGPMIFGTPAAIGWFVGVWLLTQPRPTAIVRSTTPRMEQRHARSLTRLSQLGWLALPLGFGVSGMLDQQAIAAAAAAGQAFTQTQSSKLAMLFAMLGGGVGFVGLLFFAYMLADLAEWAGDGPLAERFRLAGFIVFIAVPIAGAAWLIYEHLVATRMIGFLIALIASLGSISGIGLTAICVLQFASITYWALANQSNAYEVDRRRAERDRRFDREVAARLDSTRAAIGSAAGDPIDDPVMALDPPDEPASDRSASGDSSGPARESPVIAAESEHYIQRSGEATPFELDGSSEVDATRDPRIKRKSSA